MHSCGCVVTQSGSQFVPFLSFEWYYSIIFQNNYMPNVVHFFFVKGSSFEQELPCL